MAWSPLISICITMMSVCDGFVPSSPLSIMGMPRPSIAARSAAVDILQTLADVAVDPTAIAAAADPTAPYVFKPEYSNWSYYTSLGLYLLSAPGLYSLVKRSTAEKVKEETYALAGPAVPDAKTPREVAAEVMAYFQANNYAVADAAETIKFEGVIERSKSQAFFLVFCTGIGLATLALVLTVQLPFLGSNWYFLTLGAPYAGVYYWGNAEGTATAEVKLTQSDDDSVLEMKVRASEDELERLSTMLALTPKGKVRVKGIFEE